MIPCSFAESNVALSRPPEWTDEQCAPLSVYQGEDSKGQPIVISCWKLTEEEAELIMKTGRVWLWVFGVTMPHVVLDVNDPFVRGTET